MMALHFQLKNFTNLWALSIPIECMTNSIYWTDLTWLDFTKNSFLATNRNSTEGGKWLVFVPKGNNRIFHNDSLRGHGGNSSFGCSHRPQTICLLPQDWRSLLISTIRIINVTIGCRQKVECAAVRSVLWNGSEADNGRHTKTVSSAKICRIPEYIV